MYNTPSSTKKHQKSTEPESCQMAKMCFFFSSSSSSSDGLVQNCMTLSQWFSHKTAAVYTEQCSSPLIFNNFEVSRGGLNRSLNIYGFISDGIFKICTHVHKSLSNEIIIIQDCWIRNMVVCMKTGVFGIHCWLGVWTVRMFSNSNLLRGLCTLLPFPSTLTSLCTPDSS